MNENPNIIARNPDGSLLQSSKVSAGNTTSVIPRVASPFTGVTENILDFVSLTITLTSTQSATHTGSLFVEFSIDGVTFDIAVPVLYVSTVPFVIVPQRTIGVFFRLRYVPDDDNLTAFILTTIYHNLVPDPVQHLFSETLLVSTPGAIVRSGIMAASLDGLTMKNLQKSATGLIVDTCDSLVPGPYDNIQLGYTGPNLTSVIYKLGLAVVSTITLGYAGANLVSVVKT